jgi:hypothetical protein
MTTMPRRPQQTARKAAANLPRKSTWARWVARTQGFKGGSGAPGERRCLSIFGNANLHAPHIPSDGKNSPLRRDANIEVPADDLSGLN